MEASYKPYPINRIPQPGLDIFCAMLKDKKFRTRTAKPSSPRKRRPVDICGSMLQ
jgi:hypothetical protein